MKCFVNKYEDTINQIVDYLKMYKRDIFVLHDDLLTTIITTYMEINNVPSEAYLISKDIYTGDCVVLPNPVYGEVEEVYEQQ